MEIEDRTCPSEFLKALQKYRTIVYYFDGKSMRDIGRKLEIGPGTVSKWISKFRTKGSVVKPFPRSGRPLVIQEKEKKIIKEELKDKNTTTQKQLKEIIEEKTGNEVSCSSISRYLDTIGDYKIPYSIPILSEKNKEKRRDYAKVHEKDDFDNVIFSDESKIECCRSTKKIFIFKGEERPVFPKGNPPISIMVWGAISRKGKVNLTFVDGTIDKFKYISILENNLIKQAQFIYGNNWRFQQDNAPAHKAILVKEWLSLNVPRIHEHPAQSPDLNPIEMIWKILKDLIENQKPTTKEELKTSIIESWNSISNEIINNCINHMYKVMDYIRANDGKFCK